jgi:hypothetical protein
MSDPLQTVDRVLQNLQARSLPSVRACPARVEERRLLADTVEKVFWGWGTKFSKAADAFRARRREGTTSHLRKTITDLRIGATVHPNGGVVQKSAFARILASFDFRLFQQYRRKADLARQSRFNRIARYRA